MSEKFELPREFYDATSASVSNGPPDDPVITVGLGDGSVIQLTDMEAGILWVWCIAISQTLEGRQNDDLGQTP